MSPKAYWPIHLFPNLSPPWLLFFRLLSPLAPSFTIILILLIYKLAATAWPISPSLLLLQKTEQWEDGSGYAERGDFGEGMICQPKEDDKKNLNVSEQLALICLPPPGAKRKPVYLLL